MHKKNTMLMIAALLVALSIAATAAQAQGPCSLESFTGTYAFYERGSSSIFDPNSLPYPYHWAGPLAPFVTVGEVTIGPGGIGQGFYWTRVGTFNAGPDPVPVELTVTELNADCTGKFQYEFNLLGSSMTIKERFILFDNSHQFRSIPTSTGIPTLVWIGEGHRIGNPSELLGTCGPQTANGTYLLTVENLVRFGTNPIFTDAVLLRLDVSMNGDYTGMLYEKLGPGATSSSQSGERSPSTLTAPMLQASISTSKASRKQLTSGVSSSTRARSSTVCRSVREGSNTPSGKISGSASSDGASWVPIAVVRRNASVEPGAILCKQHRSQLEQFRGA